MNHRSVFIRIFRVLKFDSTLYKELKADNKADWQAVLTLLLADLATSIGVGIAWGFAWAGAWYLWAILFGLIGCFAVWFALSFFTYLFGTRLLNRSPRTITFRDLRRVMAFSTAPGLSGILIGIPVIGGFIWPGVLLWILLSGIFAVRNMLGFRNARAIIVYLGSWFCCILISVIILALSLNCLVSGAITQRSSFDNSLNVIIKQDRFSITRWEVNALSSEFKQWIRGKSAGDDAAKTVIEYFETNESPPDIRPTVEKILEEQIEEVLRQQGINGFPPVKFELGELPTLLVISPRDKITSIKEVVLHPSLSIARMEDIETRVDELGVSSLVVRLGGFAGIYPSYVANTDLKSTISTVVEEWVHQYLVFKPLGFHYLLDVLGISRNYEIAMMNEAVAGIVSDEICSIVIEKYYPQFMELDETQSSAFDNEMREIRRAVDDFLLQGKIEAAEEFMEEKRQYLATLGFHIRKLNQAYFAWHGTYADEPGFINPIGENVMKLRAESHSLREFLIVIAEMTGPEDLTVLIE